MDSSDVLRGEARKLFDMGCAVPRCHHDSAPSARYCSEHGLWEDDWRQLRDVQRAEIRRTDRLYRGAAR